MIRLDVGSVALASIFMTLACSDPVTNPQGNDGGPFVLADKSGADGPGRAGDKVGKADDAEIELYDDCNPNDPGWTPTGGCTLKGGKVTLDEFIALLTSPLSQSAVGHPAWRFEPSYLVVAPGEEIHLANEGGRLHTFTEVATFGGGRVPPLNVGLTMAPECALPPGAVDPNAILPGGDKDIGPLAVGNHKYMCCIHPWMRALIKVTASGSSGKHDGHSGDGR